MFDQFYQQSSDQLKLSFLQEVFQKYPDLKEDFLDYYLKPPGKTLKMTVSDPDDFVLASADILKEELESIDINSPDWQDYIPRQNGSIPECGGNKLCPAAYRQVEYYRYHDALHSGEFKSRFEPFGSEVSRTSH